MKLSEAATNDTLLAAQLRDDPEFRAVWERTAVARAIAVAVVRYRAEHRLTQRDVATRLKMAQPQVARLERGDVNPTMDTLMRVAGGLGIELVINLRPSGAAHVDVLIATADPSLLGRNASGTSGVPGTLRATLGE